MWIASDMLIAQYKTMFKMRAQYTVSRDMDQCNNTWEQSTRQHQKHSNSE